MEISGGRIEKLKQLMAEDPNDLFLRYALAMEYLGGSDLEAASAQFREVLEKDPTYTAAYYQLALICNKLGADEQAATLLEDGLVHARAQQDQRSMREFKALLDELRF